MRNIEEERRSGAEISVEVGRANELDSVERVYYKRGSRPRVNCRTSGYSFVGRGRRTGTRIGTKGGDRERGRHVERTSRFSRRDFPRPSLARQ